MGERRTPLPLAVQLYTFRDPGRFGGSGLGLDPVTLRAIADAGFLGVETVEVPGGDPASARGMLDDLGLAITSSHTWADPADDGAFRGAADYIAALGARRIIVSPRSDDLGGDLAPLVERLTTAAEHAAERGLRLGIHNHAAEMAVVDGQRVIARLVAALGDAVDVQVDIFWAVVGGADPADVIRGLGPRVVSLHLKDGEVLPGDASDEPFLNVPVGSGFVDPAPAVEAAEVAGRTEWLIVEFDHVDGSPIDAARASLENLVSRGLGRAREA